MRILFVFILLFCFTLQGLSQNVYPYAGTGIAGFNGDSIPKSDFNFDYPYDLDIDAQRNIYVADPISSRILKIEYGTGLVRVIAGTGGSSDNGDGPALSTNLVGPHYLAVANNGDVYFSELTGNRIRKLDVASNTIVTVAGNGGSGYSPDSNTPLSMIIGSPTGIDVADDGTVYFNESSNSIVRKLSPQGQVTTIAGSQGVSIYSGEGVSAITATFGELADLCLDAAGNIYVNDIFGYRIRKIEASSQIINTVVGNGTGAFISGSVPTVTGIGLCEHLFVQDNGTIIISSSNNQIYSVASGQIVLAAGTGQVGTSGDGGLATLCQTDSPHGLVQDDYGNIYFVDLGGKRIRKIEYCEPSDTPLLEASTNGFPLCKGEYVKISVGNSQLNSGDYWSWSVNYCVGSDSYGQGAFIEANLDSTTTFYVRGIGACFVTDTCGTITIEVEDCSAPDMANVITPNGDQVNDYFFIPKADDYPQNYFVVFNRWGDEVVELTDYNNDSNAWDGTDGYGNNLEEGIYYYVFEFDNSQQKGWIKILR